MDLKDLIKKKHSYKHEHDGHAGDRHYSYHHDHHGKTMLFCYGKKLLSNKKLLGIVVAVVFVALALAIMAGIWLLSQLGPVLGYVEKTGLKGAVDALLPIIQKLWEGLGK